MLLIVIFVMSNFSSWQSIYIFSVALLTNARSPSNRKKYVSRWKSGSSQNVYRSRVPFSTYTEDFTEIRFSVILQIDGQTAMKKSRSPLAEIMSFINWCQHYNDVMIGAMASQITTLTIVYSTVYSSADQRKHQSYASLAFVIPRKMARNAENVSIWWRHHEDQKIFLGAAPVYIPLVGVDKPILSVPLFSQFFQN